MMFDIQLCRGEGGKHKLSPRSKILRCASVNKNVRYGLVMLDSSQEYT
jgi:hypothetical protein